MYKPCKECSSRCMALFNNTPDVEGCEYFAEIQKKLLEPLEKFGEALAKSIDECVVKMIIERHLDFPEAGELKLHLEQRALGFERELQTSK